MKTMSAPEIEAQLIQNRRELFAIGGIERPVGDERWFRRDSDGKLWNVLVRGEWAIGFHGDTPIRCSRVEEFPVGGWQKASDAEPGDCEAGCCPFTGGERRHDPGCKHYPESMTKMLDDAKKRLAEIDAGSKADADDLAKMRDGTKMTRAGLVEIIVYQQQEIAERDATIKRLEKERDDAHFRGFSAGQHNGFELGQRSSR